MRLLIGASVPLLLALAAPAAGHETDAAHVGQAQQPSEPAAIGADWDKRSPERSPSRRSTVELAYDAAAETVLMFGGESPGGSFVLGETWAWDGSTWDRLRPRNHPSPRYLHAMAYDPVHDEVVLFGGYDLWAHEGLGDTWTWQDGNWSRQQPAASPSPRWGQMMAFDPVRQQVILFGGSDDSVSFAHDTWAWDGSSWTELQPATWPPGRAVGGLAYDPTRDRLVLFGGTAGGRYGDTWVWDGATWKQPELDRSPRPRGGMAMSTFGEHVAMFGGYSGFRELGDTWLLKHDGWRRVRDDPRPSARYSAAMEWDPVHGEAVLFGGDNGHKEFQDTWALTP